MLVSPNNQTNLCATTDVLAERGYVNQCTDIAALSAHLTAGPTRIYTGFDATADSLHVGHLVPIMALRTLQRMGHRPVILLGGGTTRIGDPSFRNDARPMLDEETIRANMLSLGRVFERFLDMDDPETGAIIVDNAQWLDELRYADVLQVAGRHLSVNRMLGFESVRGRLERQENLSFLEFNYMVLQAYDFLELRRRHGITVQLGGADQWANIINGVELVRRVDQQQVFGLTAPLLTTSSGSKMGKTAAGAVWLNADRLSPFDYWQFWRNTEDGDVIRFLRLFTDLPLSEVASMETWQGEQLNAAKELLANLATALAHGELASAQSSQAAKAVHSPESSAIPRLAIQAEPAAASVSIVEILIASGLATSGSDARRLLSGGGVRLDGSVLVDPAFRLVPSAPGAVYALSLGKKKHVHVTVAAYSPD